MYLMSLFVFNSCCEIQIVYIAFVSHEFISFNSWCEIEIIYIAFVSDEVIPFP